MNPKITLSGLLLLFVLGGCGQESSEQKTEPKTEVQKTKPKIVEEHKQIPESKPTLNIVQPKLKIEKLGVNSRGIIKESLQVQSDSTIGKEGERRIEIYNATYSYYTKEYCDFYLPVKSDWEQMAKKYIDKFDYEQISVEEVAKYARSLGFGYHYFFPVPNKDPIYKKLKNFHFYRLDESHIEELDIQIYGEVEFKDEWTGDPEGSRKVKQLRFHGKGVFKCKSREAGFVLVSREPIQWKTTPNFAEVADKTKVNEAEYRKKNDIQPEPQDYEYTCKEIISPGILVESKDPDVSLAVVKLISKPDLCWGYNSLWYLYDYKTMKILSAISLGDI